MKLKEGTTVNSFRKKNKHVVFMFSLPFDPTFPPILRHIFATGSAFCALKASGTVVAWGDVLQGGRTPDRLLLGV